MTFVSDNLVHWLISEIEERGWSHRQLGRHAGVRVYCQEGRVQFCGLEA